VHSNINNNNKLSLRRWRTVTERNKTKAPKNRA